MSLFLIPCHYDGDYLYRVPDQRLQDSLGKSTSLEPKLVKRSRNETKTLIIVMSIPYLIVPNMFNRALQGRVSCVGTCSGTRYE